MDVVNVIVVTFVDSVSCDVCRFVVCYGLRSTLL